jgi:N-carbamoylputrescine amidase
MIVNPRADVLACAGDQEDEIVYGDIDPGVIEELRNVYGFYRDRRPEFYGELAR